MLGAGGPEATSPGSGLLRPVMPEHPLDTVSQPPRCSARAALASRLRVTRAGPQVLAQRFLSTGCVPGSSGRHVMVINRGDS